MPSPIRTQTLVGDGARRGRAHGERFAAEIADHAGERVRLSGEGNELSRDQLLALAEECLAAHERYDPDLFVELISMAEAAGISYGEAIVVGGYTDFLDLVRAKAGAGVQDECTAVLVPEAKGGFLAQTWEMNASATPHVVLLQIEPEVGPAALVYTTVGCLGQIGLNEAGVAVGINNLSAADGRVGVTWPTVVRRALMETSAESATDQILSADLAGGHNFLVLDATGTGFNIEAMPTAHHVTTLDSDVLAHTNHCLAAETRQVESDRPSDLAESSQRRLVEAGELLGGDQIGLEDLIEVTRDERWICRRPTPPWHYETCGAVVIRPSTREMWACWGIPADNEFERFGLGEARS